MLGKRVIGPDSDFFDNGGHSLLAMRMIARVNKAFGVKMRVGGLFKAPTVKQFAALVSAARGAGAAPSEAEKPVSTPVAPAQAPAAVLKAAPSAAPAEETVAKIAEIWRDVLGKPQIGPDSDFFDNGGHSLLAMRMIARVNKAFDVKMRVGLLFKSPTLQGFAAAVAAAGVSASPKTAHQPRAANPAASTLAETPKSGESGALEGKLLQICASILGAPHLTLDDPFLPSEEGRQPLERVVAAAKLLGAVEQTFGVEISADDLAAAGPIRALAAQMIAKRPDLSAWTPGAAPQARARPVAAAGAQPAPTPLLALNNGQVFVRIGRRLSGGREIIDVPIGTKEDVDFVQSHSPEAMYDRLTDRIQEMQPHGPYQLLAYCGTVSFAVEAVRRLQARGEEVQLLAALDSSAPGVVAKLSFVGKVMRKLIRLKWAVIYFFELFGKYWRGHISLAYFLEAYGFIRRSGIVKALVKRGWLTKKEEDETTMDSFDFFDSMNNAASYREKPEPLNVNLVLYCSKNMYKGRFFSPTQGWEHLIKDAELVTYDLPCEHREMTRDPYASVIGVHLDDVLRDIEASAPAKTP